MTYTLCYVSKASEDLQKTAIEDIFLTTLRNNAERGLNGILLYGMGNFFQVLEGDKKKIETLYEKKIKNDPRHTEIFEVIRRFTEHPVFPDYSSLFTVVKTTEQLELIQAYLKKNKVNKTSEKLSRLLNPFLIDS